MGRRKERSVTGKKRKGDAFAPGPSLWLPQERQDPHRAAAQVLQPQLVGQLAHGHGVGHVLLVGKHQQHRIPQLVLLQLREMKGMESGVPASSCLQCRGPPQPPPLLPSSIFVGKNVILCSLLLNTRHKVINQLEAIWPEVQSLFLMTCPSPNDVSKWKNKNEECKMKFLSTTHNLPFPANF